MFISRCNSYLNKLQQTIANPEATSELSLRPHLSELLNAAREKFSPSS